jgi:hypothetical protein
VKLAVALLGIAVILLVGIMRTQANNIRDLQEEIHNLNAKLGARSKSDELHVKCGEQARKVFDDSGYPKSEFAMYENHYSAKLDKCMMQVLHTDAHTAREKMISTYVNVLDAFEGKQYGTYVWHTETSKKYLVVPPISCEVTLPTGEQKICHSMDEFEGLVKVYVEDN